MLRKIRTRLPVPCLAFASLIALRKQASELGCGLIYAIFFDRPNLLENGCKSDRLLHDVRLLQKLTQEAGEVVCHHIGQLLSVGQLNDFQQRSQVGAIILASGFFEDGGNRRISEALETI